jgi:hypothetical protein
MPNDRPDVPDRMWTMEDAAEFLRMPVNTLRDKVYRGLGPPWYKPGRHRIFKPAEVMAWAESHADGSAA